MLAAEVLLGATHYEVLGLEPEASSRQVAIAFIEHRSVSEDLLLRMQLATDIDEMPQSMFEARRREALSVLGQPIMRAAYDREFIGRNELVRRVASHVGWGQLVFGVLLFFAFMNLLDHENVSRWAGVNFAPRYREERVYVDEERCTDDGRRCVQGYFEGRFHSSDPRWESMLNSWLFMSGIPSALCAAIAYLAKQRLNPLVARAIVSVRMAGNPDTMIRWALAIAISGALVVFLVYFASYGLGRH